MKIISTIEELRDQLRGQLRTAFCSDYGQPARRSFVINAFGFVVMATLLSHRSSSIVCSSARNEDFDKYPRTFEADVEKLEKEVCMCCLHQLKRPVPRNKNIALQPPDDLGGILEGEFRPGF